MDTEDSHSSALLFLNVGERSSNLWFSSSLIAIYVIKINPLWSCVLLSFYQVDSNSVFSLYIYDSRVSCCVFGHLSGHEETRHMAPLSPEN